LTPTRDLLSRGWDIIVFANEILGVRLNRAQVRWLRYAATPRDGWDWEYKRVIHVAANQIGKSLGLAILLLWACTYKIGVNPADPDAWHRAPYLWIHLAPDQERAYLVLNDCLALIEGRHPAQVKSGLPFQLPKGLVVETKIASFYRGLEFPASGAVVQFRTSADKADAIKGYRAAAISFDEAAFEDYLTTIINETLMMRLIASEGPLFLVSTPNGMNDYYELVQEIRDLHDQPEDMVWLDRDRRWALCWSVIQDNVGFGVTQAYVDYMEGSINPLTREQQLRGAFLEPAEAFFVPQEPIIASMGIGDGDRAIMVRKLPAEQGPKPGHKYVIFWDPSVTKDPTAVVVLDITRKPWIGVYFKNWRTPMDTMELLNQIVMLHSHYNSAFDPTRLVEKSKATTGFDATAMGGHMWGHMLRGLKPNKPFDFGGSGKKLKALIDLRNILSQGELLIPTAWQQLRHEVMSYRLKDDKLTNDSAMALTGAVAVASAGTGVGTTRPFDMHSRVGAIGLTR
jgi:hypothetical protein